MERGKGKRVNKGREGYVVKVERRDLKPNVKLKYRDLLM